MSGIFDQARDAVNAALVEHFTTSPDAHWDGSEYWTRNPARGDSNVGSFSINEKGLWKDFATEEGGDLVSLLVAIRGCTKKQAAEEIIRAAGGVVQDTAPKSEKTTKPPKQKPVLPIPEVKLASLQDVLKSAWATAKHGKAVKGWTYRNEVGAAVFCVVRWERPDGSKDVIPYYYGADGKWHEGNAYEHGRPLFKLDQVAKSAQTTPVLIVEGEKCASIDVQGYIVTSWPGGCAATGKADWSPLDGREVIIWPDADEPGFKAASAIARRLPGAKILQITGKPKGWDMADAVAEGIDPVAFIAANLPKTAQAGRHDDGLPFLVLGHDAGAHYFMRREFRIPFAISRGSFNQSKLLEVAPLSFWGMSAQMITKQGGVAVAQAQDMLTDLSTKAGTYDSAKLRGAGVWRDADGVVLNDGQRLIMADRTVREFDEHASQYVYIRSSVRFSTMDGAESTDDDGRNLEALFRAQSWADPSMAPLAMGWALIAPFGGLLKWRPHIWLTGRKGSGKSYMLENLIAPLCGPFAHRGSGKDTEAGIRRSLNMDARPVILDEMEPKSARAREKITSLLELARNASSDGSGQITIGGGPDGGSVTFVIRSCFAFASVQVPDEDAAVASRIIRMELRAEDNQASKFARCAALYAECMQEPARYTRRIYRALARITSDIEWIRSEYLAVMGEQRTVDQVAPLLAAAWAAQDERRLQDCEAGRNWLDGWIVKLAGRNVEAIEDEDQVLRHVIGAHIRTDDGVQRTISELLQTSSEDPSCQTSAHQLLARHGVRIVRSTDGLCIAVAAESRHLQRILAGTPYESGYIAQVRRHRLCRIASAPVRFSGIQARACLLDWAGFQNQYMGEPGQRELIEETPF
jgi:putative DNA primase/helicase